MADTRRLCKFFFGALAAVLALSVFFGYIFYRDLKKEFLSALSLRMSSYAGQRVDISDIALAPFTKISLSGITVRNPAGFGPGRLLYLKRLSAVVAPGELLHGRIRLRELVIDSPELSPARNKGGKLNISDKLLSSFSGKPASQYRIDELRVQSGTFTYNGDSAFRNDNIELVVNNLSSSPGAKSTVRGETTYAGSRLEFNGWAYLKEEPKRFRIAASSHNFSPGFLFHAVDRYGFITSKPAMDLSLKAEGDMINGVAIHCRISVKKAGFSFLRAAKSDLDITVDSFYSPVTDSVLLNEAALSASGVAAASLKGTVHAVSTDPTYEADLIIRRLDLSALGILEGFRARGVASSQGLHIKGRSREGLPSISGELSIKKGALVTDAADLQELDADLRFASGKELSAEASLSGVVKRSGRYALSPAPKISLSLKTKGTNRILALSSSIGLSGFGVTLEGDRRVSVGSFGASSSGQIKGKGYAGRVSFDAKDLVVAGSPLREVKGSLLVSSGTGLILVKDADIKSELFRLGMASLKVALPSKSGGLSAAGEEVTLLLPENRAGVREMDFQAAFDTAGSKPAGNFSFDAGALFFGGIESGKVSGQGRFGPEGYSLSISHASIFNGSVTCHAEGRDLSAFFPLQVELTAGHLDAGLLSQSMPGFNSSPYLVSGTITHASFKGIVSQSMSAVGTASIEAASLSVRKKQAARKILGGASLTAAAIFKNKDMDIKAELGAGKLSVIASGTVGKFAQEERTVRLHAYLPELKATELREALWDAFPGSLLYAGLQGAFSSDLSLTYNRSGITAEGGVVIKDFIFTEENGRYSFGPVNGVVPVHYDSRPGSKPLPPAPPFEADRFDSLKKYYSARPEGADLSRVTVGTFRYGFDVLDGLELFIIQRGRTLNVEKFDANIFGGKLQGAALVDLSAGMDYKAGFILQGMSLRRLCSDIEPIRGYLSGMVDGVGVLKGSGGDLDHLVGKADFWTYSSDSEKTVISKEFLRKMGGPSLGSYLRDRRFDKGVMSLYLQSGYIVFRELEISNKNFFGMTDLSVKVAPYNNRISVDKLLWSISEAAQRAEKK